MICIRTPSRLHFGLFSLPSARTSSWHNQEGVATLPRRQFGGVGLMIDRPGIELTVELAKNWSAEGPFAQRALHFAQSYCASIGIQEPFHLRIAAAAPEHAGLGTGTQLGLAVARAIAELTEQPARAAVTLAGQIGRGLRSALGVHGFDHGGLLVEGGKTSADAISPLLVRHDFPEDWRILLLTPRDLQGTHGRRESEAFAALADHDADDRTTEILTRIILLGMLPALQEHDSNTFGEALYDFNRRVGALFQLAQGGLYAHPRIEEIIKMARHAGIKGVGQSSWGPTIFAMVPASERTGFSDWLVKKGNLQPEEITLASACNGGKILATE